MVSSVFFSIPPEPRRWQGASHSAGRLCEPQLREPGFSNLSAPEAGTQASGALGHLYGLFAKGACGLVAKLEVPYWHMLGVIRFR